jgi:hypothetical protein
MLDRILKFLRLNRTDTIIDNNANDISERHPGNAPGDFYSTIGCILCNSPAITAPSLIGYTVNDKGEDDHCVVIKQPKTDLEINNMIDAMESSCVECYRYAGDDINIIRLLEERKLAHLCDKSA